MFAVFRQEKAYYALAAFCENLSSEILPYLEPLMEKLLEALQSNQRYLQETCMVMHVLAFFSLSSVYIYIYIFSPPLEFVVISSSQQLDQLQRQPSKILLLMQREYCIS